MKRDSDGFVILERVIATTPSNPVTVKPEKPQDPKKPFKKGSWKNWLLKKLRKFKAPNQVKGFHFTKLTNYVIYQAKKLKITSFHAQLDSDTISTLKTKEDCTVLIRGENRTFFELSLKAYQKLCNVDRMIVSYQLIGIEDDDSRSTLMENTRIITSINELMNFINYYRQLVDGVMEVQSNCFGFTRYTYKVKTVVVNRDGIPRAFKGDFNEVLEFFHIKPLI